MNPRNGRNALLGFLVLSLAAVVSFPPITAGAQDGAKLPKLVDSLVVDAGDPGGAWSNQPLAAGLTYELRAAGTFTYGQGDSRADAECSQLLPDESWQPHRYAAMTNYRDVLDLYLDNDPVNWMATDGDPLGCNSFNNTYTHQFTMAETRHIRLFIRDIDGSYHENSGGITVRIREIDPQAEVVEPVEETAAAPSPSVSADDTRPTAAATVRAKGPTDVTAEPVANVAPAEPAVADVATEELALSLDPSVPDDGRGTLPPPPSAARELLAVLGLASWLCVVAMIIRRFQFVVVPAGTAFYAGPPPPS